MSSGQTVLMDLICMIDSGTSADVITNTILAADITLDQMDTNLANNTSSDNVTVNNISDLAVTKEVDDVDPEEGDTITYTIRLENAGPADASTVILSDACPVGTTLSGSTPSAGSYASPIWTCLLYTSPSPRDATLSRMPSSA